MSNAKQTKLRYHSDISWPTTLTVPASYGTTDTFETRSPENWCLVGFEEIPVTNPKMQKPGFKLRVEHHGDPGKAKVFVAPRSREMLKGLLERMNGSTLSEIGDTEVDIPPSQ